MAGRPTLWGAGQLLYSFFSKTAEPPPNFYLTLVRDIQPNPYVAGSELDEPTVEEGFQRAVLPNNSDVWGDLEAGTLHLVGNETTVEFITATQDLGTFRYWALCNAEVDGYVYFYGELEEPMLIATGDQPVLEAGELVIELGPFFLDELED
jgi:hypothetical protein